MHRAHHFKNRSEMKNVNAKKRKLLTNYSDSERRILPKPDDYD